MAAFVSVQLMWLSHAVLNGVLAVLLARARMGRAARGLAVALFALNAGAAVALLLRDSDVPTGPDAGFLVNILSFFPLALLPWYAPRPRATPAIRRVVIALAGVTTATLFVGTLLGTRSGIADHAFQALYHVAPAVGCLLFADAYASAPSATQRTFAATLLAGYALTSFPPMELGLRAILSGLDHWTWPYSVTGLALLGGALLTAVVSLVRRSLRQRRPAIGVAESALVAAVAVGVFLATRPAIDAATGYLLLRPFLLAYGVIGVAFAEVDIRERRDLIGVGILAVGAGIFATVWTGYGATGGAGASPGRILAALALALAAIALLGWQLTRALHNDAGEPRRLLVYRAALETARAEGRADEAALGPLRRRLRITQAEHDVIANDVNADRVNAALQPGRRFLDRYDVVRELGRGSGGVVYLARDVVDGADVAIKRLGADRKRDAAALARLQRESQLASAVQHEGLVATRRTS